MFYLHFAMDIWTLSNFCYFNLPFIDLPLLDVRLCYVINNELQSEIKTPLFVTNHVLFTAGNLRVTSGFPIINSFGTYFGNFATTAGMYFKCGGLKEQT